jgi:hypothetical protein
MKRMTWLLALAAVVVLVGTGCDQIASLDKPTVVYAAIDNGAALRLTWTAVLDASGYEIKAGDSTWTTTSTSFDVDVPAATVEVRATNGDTKSDPYTIDCGLVETATLAVYGISDVNPDHPSGIGFNADGNAIAYSLVSGNYAALDFYMEDVQLPMSIVNSGDKGWNAKGNAALEATTTNYDDLMIAGAPNTGYSTQQEIASGGLYSLWLDPTNNGWDVGDHFAKAKVISVTGVMVTWKIGYQPVAGLRWLVN